LLVIFSVALGVTDVRGNHSAVGLHGGVLGTGALTKTIARGTDAAEALYVDQGQTGPVPIVKGPLIAAPVRIDTAGAFFVMSVPSTVRFSPITIGDSRPLVT